MESLEETLEEALTTLPEIDLKTLSLFGIPATTLVAVLAAVLMVVLAVHGFQRGFIAELSPVLALVACVAAVDFAAPFVRKYVPVDWGRGIRAVVYLLLIVLVFSLVHLLLKGVGLTFRKIPLIGFTTGLLGLICGVVEALCLIFLLQKAFEMDLFGAIRHTFETFV